MVSAHLRLWALWLLASAAPLRAPEVAHSPVPTEAVQPAPEPVQSGTASYYSWRFHGRETASGEPYDLHELTAAHPWLPFGTRLRVQSARTGRAVTVTVTDRGPYVPGRIVDLSLRAALALGMRQTGIDSVALYVMD